MSLAAVDPGAEGRRGRPLVPAQSSTLRSSPVGGATLAKLLPASLSVPVCTAEMGLPLGAPGGVGMRCADSWHRQARRRGSEALATAVMVIPATPMARVAASLPQAQRLPLEITPASGTDSQKFRRDRESS